MIFREVQLQSHDLDATQYFYNGMLQFPISLQSNSSIGFQVGHTQLIFSHTDINAIYHFAFKIPSHLFSLSYEWVKQRIEVLPFSEETEIADFSNWNAKAFYFHDPNGNILEFISHFDSTLHKDEAFASTAIEGINEIGIPVKSVRQSCEDFKSTFNIPYFHKGPCMEDFSVMGDENGMLIVTREQRGWLPTLEPAVKHPILVRAIQNNTEFKFGL
jgi:catechol 2,3-dioxygenase-like lactoylglutathione lyase family enzyme